MHDEVSPLTREFIRARRTGKKAPETEVADFEEYRSLYHESWGDPTVRWLLSTVPSAMIFDDHDVHDDWNTSAAWVRKMRAKPWWEERVIGAFTSYWLFQHLGNLSPAELEADQLFRQVRAFRGDAMPLLREAARAWMATTDGSRWSFSRDLGTARLVVIDSRAGRVLEPERRMVDAEEWEYVVDRCAGDFDHLLLASSLPVLLEPGLHWLEAWSEQVAGGSWGRAAARIGEEVRQRLDLEHWAAFAGSFRAIVELVRAVAAGELGAAPRTITFLSGDVHHAYVAEVAFRRSAHVVSRVSQAVCSPIRNPLGRRERTAIRILSSPPAATVLRGLARLAGAPDPEIRWRLGCRPIFDNQIATLELDGADARLTVERSHVDRAGEPSLAVALSRTL